MKISIIFGAADNVVCIFPPEKDIETETETTCLRQVQFVSATVETAQARTPNQWPDQTLNLNSGEMYFCFNLELGNSFYFLDIVPRFVTSYNTSSALKRHSKNHNSAEK